MAKKKNSALGKRLIASAKEMVAHARGELELDEYEVRVPPQVDSLPPQRLGLSQRFARRFGFSPGPFEDWEQAGGRSAAYLLVIAAGAKAAGIGR